LESALQQAQQVAGEKDIRIVGDAQVIQQYLDAGLVDEFTIHYAPLFLGQGTHLFDRIDKNRFSVQIMKAVHSPLVTHLQFKVMPK
jgi:dihydrofolate reductase